MIPKQTHLQLLILGLLQDGEKGGAALREEANTAGAHRMSRVSFYLMMSKLEKEGLVKGRYIREIVNGHNVSTRHYRLLKAGVRAVEQVRKFYDLQQLQKQLSAIPAAA